MSGAHLEHLRTLAKAQMKVGTPAGQSNRIFNFHQAKKETWEYSNHVASILVEMTNEFRDFRTQALIKSER